MDETRHAALFRVGRASEEFLRLAQVCVDAGILDGGLEAVAEKGPGAGFRLGRRDRRALVAAAQQAVPIGRISVRASEPDRERIARKRARACETVHARSRDVRIAGAAQRDRAQADAVLPARFLQQVLEVKQVVGLFVFGVCGLAFIYVLAPLLDNLIRKINRKVLVPLAVTLVMIIAADFVYSNFVPNTGYGITGNFDNEDDVTVESVLEEG